MCQHNRLTAPPLSLFLLQTSSNRIETSLRNVFRIHSCAFVIFTQILYLSCRSVFSIVCPFQLWSFDGSCQCGFKESNKRFCFYVSTMELKPNLDGLNVFLPTVFIFFLNECIVFSTAQTYPYFFLCNPHASDFSEHSTSC